LDRGWVDSRFGLDAVAKIKKIPSLTKPGIETRSAGKNSVVMREGKKSTGCYSFALEHAIRKVEEN
jgi:hypothetical protein